MQKLLKLKYLQIFLIGLFLRILVMPFTFHWDLYALNIVASEFIKHGPLAFYTSYISDYPPLTYLSLGIWQLIIKPLTFSDFYRWLDLPSIVKFLSIHNARYLFLLKSFYIPFDLGIAYILGKFGRNENEKKILSSLWLFNPIVLYVVFMWGTIDIVPTFFVLLSIYLIREGKTYLPLILLCIGALFKLWPVLLIPFALVTISNGWKKRTIGLVLCLLVSLLILLPYLRIGNFWTYVIFSDRASMMGNGGLYLGFSQWLLVYPFLCLIGLLYTNRNYSGIPDKIIDVSFIVLIIFYITSAFTPQWFLWILPLFIIQVVRYPTLFKPFVLIFIGYGLVILTFDITLSLGLFGPMEPTLWQAPFVKEYVEKIVVDSNKIWSAFRTINSVFLIWFVYEWYLVRRKNEKNSN